MIFSSLMEQLENVFLQMGTVSASQHYHTCIPCSRFKHYEDHYVITQLKKQKIMLVFLQHKNCQSRSKRTLPVFGLICRTTRTDKEIHSETADISSQKEIPCRAYAEVVSSHLNTMIITNHCPQAVMQMTNQLTPMLKRNKPILIKNETKKITVVTLNDSFNQIA